MIKRIKMEISFHNVDLKNAEYRIDGPRDGEALSLKFDGRLLL